LIPNFARSLEPALCVDFSGIGEGYGPRAPAGARKYLQKNEVLHILGLKPGISSGLGIIDFYRIDKIF